MNFRHLFLSVLVLVTGLAVEVKGSQKAAKKDNTIVIVLPEAIAISNGYFANGHTGLISNTSEPNSAFEEIVYVPGRNIITKNKIYTDEKYNEKEYSLRFLTVMFGFNSSGRLTREKDGPYLLRRTSFGCTIFKPCWGKKYIIRPLWVNKKDFLKQSENKKENNIGFNLKKVEKESALKTPEYYQKIRDGAGEEPLTGDYCREGEIFSRALVFGPYHPSCYTIQDIEPEDLVQDIEPQDQA